MRAAFCILAFAALLPGQAQKKLAPLLPDPRAFGGKPASAAAFYSADLYRYLDGGAEAYHQRGFAALVHREYKAKDVELTVDIYDMGDRTHAMAMYSAERSPESASVRIGAAGCSGEGFLNFAQGRYYVKLIAFGNAAKTAAALRAAATSISGKIHE